MKIQNIKNPEALFEVINKCSGRVELVTGEGDRLNLKSKLCQLISLANIFSMDVSSIPDMELIAYEPEDVKKLLDFMVSQS